MGVISSNLMESQHGVMHLKQSYGTAAWGNASHAILKRSNILQKLAIRTVYGAKYNSHAEPLFKLLNIIN